MNIDKIHLKPMTKNDLNFVNTTRNLFSTRKWLENNNEISLEDTVAWFERDTPRWYIIYLNEDRVGYIRTSDDTGKSLCIGCDIHPDYRRKGIAFRAYKLFMEELYKNGYVLIWLDVYAKNTAAYSLYDKLGFIPIGNRSNRDEAYVTMVHSREA